MMLHPFEIEFCGPPRCGKTTVIEKLKSRLFGTHQVGIFKSPSPSFEGKKKENRFESYSFNEDNFLFIEGFYSEKIKKIQFLTSESEIFANTIAVVGKEMTSPFNLAIPYFCREDIDGIKEFILNEFRLRVPPLFGLVLTGGKSRRMGVDKSLIEYKKGIPQALGTFELLDSVCEKTFLSLREDQRSSFVNVDSIEDRLLEMGPMGGILSAMLTFPNASWLVAACDLPNLDKETLFDLVQKRNPYKMATYYLSNGDGLPEPLCAIYERKARLELFLALGLDVFCPRKVLMNRSCEVLHLKNKQALINVNDQAQAQAFRTQLEGTP